MLYPVLCHALSRSLPYSFFLFNLLLQKVTLLQHNHLLAEKLKQGTILKLSSTPPPNPVGIVAVKAKKRLGTDIFVSFRKNERSP
jgi:hypothetical protein